MNIRFLNGGVQPRQSPLIAITRHSWSSRRYFFMSIGWLRAQAYSRNALFWSAKLWCKWLQIPKSYVFILVLQNLSKVFLIIFELSVFLFCIWKFDRFLRFFHILRCQKSWVMIWTKSWRLQWTCFIWFCHSLFAADKRLRWVLILKSLLQFVFLLDDFFNFWENVLISIQTLRIFEGWFLFLLLLKLPYSQLWSGLLPWRNLKVFLLKYGPYRWHAIQFE
jgi:hypothetical protein